MQNAFVRIITFSLCLVFIGGCRQQNEDNKKDEPSYLESGEDFFLHKTTISHSQGFSVEYHPNYKIVTVHGSSKNERNAVKYLLIQKGTPIPDHEKDIQVITIPIESIASISTSRSSAQARGGTVREHERF
jgi:iron complex transport system substrate-binding protein